MGSIWTVQPDTRRLDLVYVDPDGNSHPFWVKVKRRLTVGETRRMQTAGFGGMRQAAGTTDAEVSVDWQSMSFARADVYVTDWSLEDDKQTKLPVKRETIEALHPDVFKLIEDAITKHVEEMAAEKNSGAGGTRPSAISA